MDIRKVGIVGAGQMGNGIAHVFALAGYDVVLNDIAAETLDKAHGLIGRNLDRQVTREKIIGRGQGRGAGPDRHDAGHRRDRSDCDLVIEAATENEDGQAQDLRACAASGARRRS